MTKPIYVELDGVSKVYRRGAERTNLRAALPGRWGRPDIRDGFPALTDVTIKAEQGEILGVIGQNGAGKSTLLKLIARTIAPTKGRVRTTGRIASLIELGVGFHPDLTGFDNVRFSAAVLGMSTATINRRYDEIVAFAGIEEFMGTPVKRYSSGMLARLGFAVASHLDADILLVDEVLSVGDAAFQRRGFERMKQLQTSGATLLFVSHNLLMIPELCERAVRLDRGTVVDQGDPAEVVDRYMASSAGTAGRGPDAGAAAVRILEASLASPVIRTGDPLGVRLVVNVEVPHEDARATLVITALSGMHLAGMDLDGSAEALARGGTFTLEGQVDTVSLSPDDYRVMFTIVEEVHGVPLALDQAATTLAVTGNELSRQYGSTYLSGSFAVAPLEQGGTR